MTPRCLRGQAGQAIVLMAFIIVVLIGFLGLAIDGGRVYVDRRELQVAADSAALAAADKYVVTNDMAQAQRAAADVFAANSRLYTSGSASWCANPPITPVSPYTTCTATVTYAGDSHQLTIGYTDKRVDQKGIVFTASASHSLAVAFMQVLGVGGGVNLGAVAASVIYDNSETPAILALGRAPCDGTSGSSLTVQGGAGLSVTVVGAVYSDGGITVGNGINVNVAGNAYSNCGGTPISGITNPGFTDYSPVAPIAANYLGGTSLSVYTAGNYHSDQSWPSSSGNVEVQPGVYNSNPQITGGSPCYFLDAGMYQFPSGFTDNAGMVSNDLRPPDEPTYYSNTTRAGSAPSGNPTSSTDPSYVQLWRANSACDGTFSVQSVQSTGGGGHPLTPASTWGIEVTAARQDAFYPSGTTAVNYLRESSPSMCRTVGLNGSNAGFQVSISNVPGAQWYNLYANPGGCSGNFGYFGTVCSGQTSVQGCSQSLTMTGNKTSCPNLPSWNGNNAITSGPNQNSGTCTLGYTVSGIFDSSNLGGFSPSGTPCTRPPTTSTSTLGCAPPDPELCPVGVTTSGTSCITGAPNANAGRNTPNLGDQANENQCSDNSGNQGSCPGSVTPGGVQIVFGAASNSCMSQGGGGGVWLFGGKQYDWMVLYSTNASCSGANPNKIVGGAITSYTGTFYFPSTSITLSGGGQTAIADQVIALNVTIDGSSGVTVAYNPNYVPSPPAGRLVT